MDDNIMDYAYGMPLAWLFSPEENILVTRYGKPISEYMTTFDYTYDEENDDVCNIKLQFDRVSILDLDYLKPDVVMLVQWGFMLPNGETVRSPKRKVAIRDIKTEYSINGIILNLVCTDLVSYLRGMKTFSAAKYKGDVGAETKAADKGADNFIDFFYEDAAGKFVPTVTYRNKTSKYILERGVGKVFTADYDTDRDLYIATRESTAVPLQTREFFFGAITRKGSSRSLTNEINNKLQFAADVGVEGEFVMDSTDETLHLHRRFFDRPIFRRFTWAAPNGELLEFKTNTQTRKIKQDKASTSDVNPYTKETEYDEVDIAVAEKAPEEEGVEVNQDYMLEGMKQYLNTVKRTFEHNVKYPADQREVPPYRYTVPKEKRNSDSYTPPAVPYDERIVADVSLITIPTKEIINIPEFTSMLEEDRLDTRRSNSQRRQDMLTGYLMEKIQRKFEATAKFMGDPSLIKGKVYQFCGLSEKDNGEWYGTRVKHKITRGAGYTVEMDLLRKPQTVGLSAKNYKSKLELLSGEEKLELQEKISMDADKFFNRKKIKPKTVGEAEERLDEDYVLEKDIQAMSERLDKIQEEEKHTLGTLDKNMYTIPAKAPEPNTENR